MGLTSRVVDTALGAVRGVAGDVVEYRGVPFGDPARGELRWAPPRPVAGWSGVRDATAFAPDCPQPAHPRMKSRAPHHSEDCLHLDIWAPLDAGKRLYPVMVWFHGGSFLFGSTSAPVSDATHLARQGAVIVSVGYRVGLFGFLAHPGLTAESPHDSSGNYGLLDQIEALRWIRRHIGAFGGDSANVTGFGVSAGSASLALLLASPLADGLLDRVILESPGAFRPLADLAAAESAGCLLGDDIGALRHLSAEEVVVRSSLLNPAVRSLSAPRVLRPIVDGWVLPDQEIDVHARGGATALPAIIGNNFDEGTTLTAAWPVNTWDELDTLLRRDFPDDHERVLATYRTDTSTPGEVIAAVFADSQFNLGARSLARSLRHLGADVYRYAFTRRRPTEAGGPQHGDEVPYVFGNLVINSGYDDNDRIVSEVMRDSWVRFAQSGSPAAAASAWPRYTDGNETHLELGDEIRVASDWRVRELDVMESLLPGSD